MTETEAREIAHDYVAKSIVLVPCETPVHAFYQNEKLEDLLFFKIDTFFLFQGIGSGSYVAVSKRTGRVTFAGSIGE